MKKIILLFMLCFILLVSAVSAVPKLVPYVNDFAGLMGDSEKIELNSLCGAIENTTVYEVILVTVKNTEGINKIGYANQLSNTFGSGNDKWIVVLWSEANERGEAIIAGRSIEGVISDSVIGEINKDSNHFFDMGETYYGFLFIVDRLNETLANTNTNINTTSTMAVSTGTRTLNNFFLISLYLLIGIGVLAFFYLLIKVLRTW